MGWGVVVVIVFGVGVQGICKQASGVAMRKWEAKQTAATVEGAG